MLLWINANLNNFNANVEAYQNPQTGKMEILQKVNSF